MSSRRSLPASFAMTFEYDSCGLRACKHKSRSTTRARPGELKGTDLLLDNRSHFILLFLQYDILFVSRDLLLHLQLVFQFLILRLIQILQARRATITGCCRNEEARDRYIDDDTDE